MPSNLSTTEPTRLDRAKTWPNDESLLNMKFCVTLALALSAGGMGCAIHGSQGPTPDQDVAKAMEHYNAAIYSGTHGRDYPGQFHRLYPESINFISYYSGEAGPPMWTSKVGLYQRYLLTMQVPIKLNRERTKVVSAENPNFYLDEFLSITPGKAIITFDANGQQISTSGMSRTAAFDATTWSRLLKAKGDFGAIGLTLTTNKPVQGFETSWQKF